MKIILAEQELTTFEITMGAENNTAFNVEDLLAVNETLSLFGYENVVDKLLNVDGVMYVHLNEYDTCLNPNSFFITVENETIADEQSSNDLITSISEVLAEMESRFSMDINEQKVTVSTISDLNDADDFDQALNLMSHTSGFRIVERGLYGERSIIQFPNGLYSELEVTRTESSSGPIFHFHHSLRNIHTEYKECKHTQTKPTSQTNSVAHNAIMLYCSQRGLENIEINSEETRFSGQFPWDVTTQFFFAEPARQSQGIYISLLVSDDSGYASMSQSAVASLTGFTVKSDK